MIRQVRQSTLREVAEKHLTVENCKWLLALTKRYIALAYSLARDLASRCASAVLSKAQTEMK